MYVCAPTNTTRNHHQTQERHALGGLQSLDASSSCLHVVWNASRHLHSKYEKHIQLYVVVCMAYTAALLVNTTPCLTTPHHTTSPHPQVDIHIDKLDMQDINSVTSLPQSLPVGFQHVDILINNAGLALGTSPVHENNLDDIATMLQTNVMGLIALTRVLTPDMVDRNKGHIVNISSIAGHEAYGGGCGGVGGGGVGWMGVGGCI